MNGSVKVVWDDVIKVLFCDVFCLFVDRFGNVFVY